MGFVLSGLLAGSLLQPAGAADTKGSTPPKSTEATVAQKPASTPAPKAGAAPSPAPGDAETIDRVVAVVNDEQILLSEVQEQMSLFQAAQKIELKDSTQVAQLQKQVLDQLIEEKLIVDYATKQGITISDDQVNARIDETIKNIKDRLGSEEAFQKELQNQNMTLESLKDRYRQDIRRQMMAQRIVDREIRNKVKVNDADVDTFYRNNKDKLPPKPGEYHLAHILVTPKPDANRRAAARGRANDVLRQLEAGADWDKMVEKYSEDPSTKGMGGDLGDVREGEFDEQFEAGVHDLEPGQRSGLVETRFGFHIIEMVSRDGDHYHPKHILIKAMPTPTDQAAAIERADKARDMAVKGTDWATLVNSYSDDPGTKDKAGDLGNVPASALPPEYIEALDSLKVGGVSQVLEGPTGYHIFKLIGREVGRPYTLEEIRTDLMNELTKRKLSEEYDHWIAGIRKKAFIEIK